MLHFAQLESIIAIKAVYRKSAIRAGMEGEQFLEAVKQKKTHLSGNSCGKGIFFAI